MHNLYILRGAEEVEHGGQQDGPLAGRDRVVDIFSRSTSNNRAPGTRQNALAPAALRGGGPRGAAAARAAGAPGPRRAASGPPAGAASARSTSRPRLRPVR